MYSYVLIYTLYMKKCCDCEKTSLEILLDLHILIPCEYKKVVFGMSSLSVYVCISLGPEQVNGLYSYSVFKNLSVLPRSLPSEYEHFSSKNRNNSD
jgi:hypothetical protein